MEIEFYTEEQLIDFANHHGCDNINHWKLERWHKEDVIPRPVVMHLGYGMGTRSMYPIQAGSQVLAVCRLLEQARSFDVIRFRLWQEGYPIPLPVLKKTIDRLAPLLRLIIPYKEEQRYEAAEQQVDDILTKLTKRRSGFASRLMKRMSLDNLQSFFTIQMYLSYGINYIFEPSHFQGEASSMEILAEGLNLNELRFLSDDFTATFQSFSNKRLFSIRKMKIALAEATEEDLRRANDRADVVALALEFFDLIGFLPKLLHIIRSDVSDPSFKAMSLVAVLHLERSGFADNMNGLLEALRVQMPRIRAFDSVYLALENELPAVANELGRPHDLWKQIKDLPEPDREQYLARKNDHLRGIYVQYQAELEAFWQRHPEIYNVLNDDIPSPLSEPDKIGKS
jgi:hypothetical protein